MRYAGFSLVMITGCATASLVGCQLQSPTPATRDSSQQVGVVARVDIPTPNLNGVAEPGTVTVEAPLKVGSERRLQAVVNPWLAADIDHVQLQLFIGASTTATSTFAVPKANLATVLKFNNLSYNTSYRVEARAWQDAAETVQIDDSALAPASCTTNFTTTTDAVLALPSGVALKLKDKAFAGQGSGTISVTDGVLSNTTTTPSISF